MTDFHLLITNWYRQNSRKLPWRETKDPYFIWLSEIILQQTRVDQGMSYYLKFTTNYPSVEDLAKASEQQVLNDWQGLGYYSRARNLHATAKYISGELNNEFPNNYDEILKLKGVGPYTAAAISSFVFNERKAVVDGNVYRVLSRIFDIETPIDSSEGKKQFQELADSLISEENPGEFNQAIMEFGATYCVPSNPNCDGCIFNMKCLGRENGNVQDRPIKVGKTKVRNRYFYYAVFSENKRICVKKRIERDIWQEMYDFPLLESEHRLTEGELINHFWTEVKLKPYKISTEVCHVLSHQKIFAQFIHFDSIPSEFNEKVVAFEDLNSLPLPRLIDRYLENHSV